MDEKNKLIAVKPFGPGLRELIKTIARKEGKTRAQLYYDAIENYCNQKKEAVNG